MNPKQNRFDHEKLNVSQRSLKFISWATDLVERVPTKLSAHGQLDRAGHCRFFDIARGSSLECAAASDVLVAKKVLTEADVDSHRIQTD